METHIKHFSELTTEELYGILRLRAEVFVVEQDCPYQDLDDKDQEAFHIFSTDGNGEIVACLRVFAPNQDGSVIGRVVTSRKVRGTGLALRLMETAKETAFKQYGPRPIRLHAQCYATGFYRKCGFTVCSGEFMEDGIPHVEMICTPPSSEV